MKRTAILLLLSIVTISLVQGQTPTPEQIRQSIAQSVIEMKGPPMPVGTVENRFVRASKADSVAIRIYRPTVVGSAANRPLPIIYQVHGGAWVAGDLDTHDNICRRLCHDANAVVVAVDYRRPPEHPYPASLDDVMTVLTWIQTNRASLSQAGPLILLGDSAGGTFVAAACLRNADGPKPVPIAAQILVNPALDVRPGSAAFGRYELVIRWGLPDLTKANEPYASPLTSSRLQTMPPASIVVSELDELKNDGVQMDQKLRAAGVKSTLFEQEKIGHFGPVWCADNAVVKPALTFVLQQILKTSN